MYELQSQLAKVCQKKAKGDVGSSCRNEEEERKMWNQIWSLDIKKKIQHFIWRAFHNQLLVEVNLKKRGTQVDGVCRQCGEGMETMEHLFFHCAKAKMVWRLAPANWEGLQ